jgi:hypothetical protein
MKVYIHNSSILVHIHRKTKIALEIAATIASVYGPLIVDSEIGDKLKKTLFVGRDATT